MNNVRFYDLISKESCKEIACKRYFCKACVTQCYDQDFDSVKADKEWICPYCQVFFFALLFFLNQGICYCSRCLRQDQITKLKALYVALDGSFDCPISHDPVEQYANISLVQTTELITTDDGVNDVTEKLEKSSGTNRRRREIFHSSTSSSNRKQRRSHW